jgi:hypothetical protein
MDAVLTACKKIAASNPARVYIGMEILKREAMK